jgi:hypothetical protein
VISLSDKAVVLNTLEGLTIIAAVDLHYNVNKAAVRYITKYEDKLGRSVKNRVVHPDVCWKKRQPETLCDSQGTFNQ